MRCAQRIFENLFKKHIFLILAKTTFFSVIEIILKIC